MNENTVVAIFGYAGDSHQVKMLWPYYIHHRCPIIVLSPEDSPITSRMIPTRVTVYYNRPGNPSVLPSPPVLFKHSGKRAYTGPESLYRQRLQLELLLKQFSQEWFLLNDSDSVVLSAALPRYIYNNPNKIWSNIVDDSGCHPLNQRVSGYPWPQLAFQPPYFLHRQAIQKIINAAPAVPVDPRTPFIDWCMMSWSIQAGLEYQGFPDGCSGPTNDANPGAINAISNAVRNEGKIFIHSVKNPHILQRLAADRLTYKKAHGIR